MNELEQYTYSITCDICNEHVCWWRWGGPFNGSVVCDRCYSDNSNRMNNENS